MDRISRFQFLTVDHPELSHQEQAEQACQAGVEWIQLRMKRVCSPDAVLCVAQDLRRICAAYGSTLIVNDFAEIAKAVGADGVHLGKEDMDVSSAREILGPDSLIGATANNFEELHRAAQCGASYIGLGPYRDTKTKEKLSPVLGVEGVSQLIEQMRDAQISLPVLVIGGVRPEDLTEILATGAHGVAVSSALSNARTLSAAATNFLQGIGRFHDKQFATL